MSTSIVESVIADDPPLVAAERAKGAARVAASPERARAWADMTTAEQDRWLRREARRRVIFGTPTGRAAVRVLAAVDELQRALSAVERGCTEERGREECRAALACAGLSPPEAWEAYGTDHFDSFVENSPGLLYLAELAARTLDEYDGPDDDEQGQEDEPEEDAVPVARLVAAFLSADARAVLEVVAARGPVLQKNVVAALAATGPERSKCCHLLADLRARGLIAGGGDGYALADPELWAAVAAGG